MKPRPKHIIFCVALAGAFVTTSYIISEANRARAREHTLPDGSRVVLRAVTYGNTHRFPIGNVWQQVASRMLPTKYTSRFPSLVYDDTNSGPTLVVWIEHLGPTTKKNVQYGGDPTYSDPPDWQGLFDDSGTDHDKYHPDLSGSTGRGFVQGFVFHALPSTSRELRFRFVCSNSAKEWQDTAVFTFPNPTFRRNTQSHAANASAAQQGKLTFVLNGFHAEPRRTNRMQQMSLSFDLFEDGHPANDWRLHSLVVLDPNGAGYLPYSSEWGRRENHTRVTFVGGLSTNEGWKLRFGLRRDAFLSNELCTVRGIPIAVQSDTETNLLSIPFQGTTLTLRRDIGAARLTAMVVPPDEVYYLNFVDILAANDLPFDRGKTYYVGQHDSHYSMGFPPGVTNVDLTFGITRKVFIEVVAQPTAR